MTVSFFSRVSSWVIVALLFILFILVLLVLPISDNFIYVSKSFVLFFSTLIVVTLFIIRSMRKQAFELSLSPYTIPLFGFAVATLASTFFTSPYPVENLLGFGGVYLSFVLLALFGSGVIVKRQAPLLLPSLAGVTVILTFLSALELSGKGPSHLLNTIFAINLPTNMLFNLSGSSLIALQVVLVALVGLLTQVVVTKKLSKLSAVTLPILLLGAGLFIWSLLPGKPAEPIIPSFGASWSVMLDVLRNPRSALIGVGPASYSSAYLQFKPVWMNATQNWGIGFSQAANMPLSLVTSLGLIGLTAWGWLVVRIFKNIKSASQEAAPYVWMLVASVALQLVLPPNVILVGIQALLLATLIALEKTKHSSLQIRALETRIVRTNATETTGKSLALSSLIGGGISLVVVAILFYLSGRAYAAHYYMGKAEKAAIANDGVAIYQNQLTAVNLNPYLDSFRRSWASTNILIAAALSNKADATDAEKEQSGQLVQQAVREARSATILDPNDTQNWIVLAQIYSNLIGSVEQADQLTVQTYVRAIELSPADPTLRLSLGGIFLGQKNYQQAASLFQQSIQLKTDYANGYYNLGTALKELGQHAQAKASFETLLTLLPENSDDYTTVMQEIEALDKILAEQEKQSGQNQQQGGSPGAGQGTQGSQAQPQAGQSLLDQNLTQNNAIVTPPSDGVELENPQN